MIWLRAAPSAETGLGMDPVLGETPLVLDGGIGVVTVVADPNRDSVGRSGKPQAARAPPAVAARRARRVSAMYPSRRPSRELTLAVGRQPADAWSGTVAFRRRATVPLCPFL